MADEKKAVMMFHLVDGKDIVAEVVQENDRRYLKSPFEFIFSPAGAGLIPFMAMAKGHVIPYPKVDDVMFECEPADNLRDEYINATKPKGAIATPKRPGILVPG